MLQFTLGAKTNEDLNINLLETPEITLPGTTDRVQNIPRGIGEVRYGGEYNALVFHLECEFTGAENKTALRGLIRDLTDHLTTTEGEPQELGLVFPEEPELAYTVFYDNRGELTVDKIAGGAAGKFTLRLKAPDPRAKAPEETVSKTITTSEDSINIENAGNVETPLEIKIINNGSETIQSFTLTKLEE